MSIARLRWGAALGGALALAVACATPSRQAFEDAHKRYTRMLRWSDFDRAAEYVRPEDRAAFDAQARRFGDLRFTDYEIRSVELDPSHDEARVLVRYSAYRRSALAEILLDEEQAWSRDPETGAWRVRSALTAVR